MRAVAAAMAAALQHAAAPPTWITIPTEAALPTVIPLADFNPEAFL